MSPWVVRHPFIALFLCLMLIPFTFAVAFAGAAKESLEEVLNVANQIAEVIQKKHA